MLSLASILPAKLPGVSDAGAGRLPGGVGPKEAAERKLAAGAAQGLI